MHQQTVGGISGNVNNFGTAKPGISPPALNHSGNVNKHYKLEFFRKCYFLIKNDNHAANCIFFVFPWKYRQRAPHRDLKSNSNKSFCNRVLTIQVIILGHRESKKSCLNFCRNRNFNINFSLFVKQILIFRDSLYITVKIISERSATFLSELYILILKILVLEYIFYKIKCPHYKAF